MFGTLCVLLCVYKWDSKKRFIDFTRVAEDPRDRAGELDVHTPASPAPRRLSEEDASSGPASQRDPVSALLSQIKQDKKNP